jgi:hypothetical protein
MTPAERRELKVSPQYRASTVAQIADPLLQQAAAQAHMVQLARAEGEERRQAAAASRMAVPRVRFRR